MIKRAIIAIALVGIVMLSAGCAQVPIVGQPSFGTYKKLLYGKTKIGQDFFSSDRNLMRIDVFLYPSKLLKGKLKIKERDRLIKSLAGKNVVLRLRSWPKGKDQKVIKKPVTKIEKAGMHSFYFKPIAASKRRQYYFSLEAPRLNKKTAIFVRITSHDRYKKGAVYIKDKKTLNMDMNFQPYIYMNTIMLVHSIAARVAGDLPFIIFWAAIVIILFVVTIISWRQESRER